MSSSDSFNSYNADDYMLERYEQLEGPPLIKKKSRLVAAVVQNQVGVLSDLLDSSKWYNVQDSFGFTLLQTAIIHGKIEVFDYMLSIPDFPLEFVNIDDQTALEIAFTKFLGTDICMKEHFAYELIKKGVCIDQVYSGGNTPLHCALLRSFHKTAVLLIQKGVDVNLLNLRGCSPLDIALSVANDKTEVVTTLLAYGAEPSAYHFRKSVLCNDPFDVQEALFLYIYDQYSRQELCFDAFLELAEKKSALFYRFIGCSVKLTIQNKYAYIYFRKLCSVNVDCLRLIIQNFSPYIKKAFLSNRSDSFPMFYDFEAICLENLNLMLESELKRSVISLISTLSGGHILEDLIKLQYDEVAITQLFCYLLGYGLKIDELVLQIVYHEFGYCELFKILLHMDVRMDGRNPKNIMAVFIYDIGMNLEQFFQNYSGQCVHNSNELYYYFVHPKLKTECSRHNVAGDLLKWGNQEIPLLVELARNAFRMFFIKKFNIRSCKELYTRLKWLPISNVYKKIISYETKLY